MTDQNRSEQNVTTTLFSLSLTRRETVPLVSGLVAEAAALLRLDTVQSARLRVVTQELADEVVNTAFEDEADIDLECSLLRRPGGISIVLTDRGAPSQLTVTSTNPPRVGELVGLGYADSVRFQNLGRQGNRAELFKRLTYATLVDDPDFQEASEEQPEAVELGPDGSPLLEYRAMTADDVVAVARLFYRCYGLSAYTVDYAYEPDRFAEYVRSGIHIGTVAVTPSGRIVGHLASKVLTPGAKVSVIGWLVVDPAYREYRISNPLTMTHATRLIAMGFIGQYGQAVTVHTKSQAIAVKFGGHEVAITLAAQQASIEFKGFPGGERMRRALIWFYNGSGKEPRRDAHVPAVHREIVREIYDNAKLPRDLPMGNPRSLQDLPPTTQLELNLKHDANAATIEVQSYGRDFLEALQRQLAILRMNRYEMAVLFLPLTDPHTSVMGGGLHELGFHFSGVLPEYADGDMLLLTWLNDVEFLPEEVTVVTEFGQHLKDFVIKDYDYVVESEDRQRRSRSAMARIYEALQ